MTQAAEHTINEPVDIVHATSQADKALTLLVWVEQDAIDAQAAIHRGDLFSALMTINTARDLLTAAATKIAAVRQS